MSDDLEKLRSALKAATPDPDPAAKAAAMARAMESFDRHQESEGEARPISDRPNGTGFPTGVLKMLMNLTSRPALTATASVAALCVGLIVVVPAIQKERPGSVAVPEVAETARERAADASVPEVALSQAEPELQTAPADEEAAQADDVRTLTLAESAPAPDPAAPAAKMAEGRAGALADSDMDVRTLIGSAPKADATFAPALAEPNTEVFANEDANPVKSVTEEPVSTFSIDVDTASYSVVRSSLKAGYLPPADAVRVEEMVNYFPYAYPAPEADDAPFRPKVSVVPTPWNEGTRLVHIGIQGRLPALGDRPPLNLVFLIDTSGSMQDANKLPLLKQSFRLMLGELRPEDEVAIVTYAGSAGQVLAPTPASDQAAIMAALDGLEAGGSTAGQEGLEQAYAVAEGMAADGEVTRVILATDGDFNVGISDPDALKSYIETKRKSGTYLSVLGFGRGNLDDATMQALAQNGNGTAAYIDTLSEAQKVLVDQLTGALFPIANDVKVQVEFNPAVVAEYRLIGYETRALRREDFNNDKVDAGDIGAGHTVTAIYEVTPVGSPAVLNEPLRYQPAEAQPELAAEDMELGFLKLRYKEPGASVSQLIEMPIPVEPEAAGEDARFAIAVAGFGQLLTGARYLGDWGWDEVIALANGAKGDDPFGYRTEAVQLMRLAESLSR
ncbi:VWA domain-containing protein [Ostreiculturibacter nitratireducens]|uniref:vWA domain-containing protein n=1 Tax=Ostreiculturibacter nitratireducens TaxID=3075226 RepID=UPI0031B5CEF8